MKLELSVSQRSFGAQGDDVARVQRAMQALGRSVPAGERGVLGAGTVAVLKALQAELSLPASGIVDSATVKAINARLAKRATDPRVVRGIVRDADGTPFAEGLVQIFGLGSDGEQVIGKSELNATDGSYAISYQQPPKSTGRIDLRVAVLIRGGDIVETTLKGAGTLSNAGPLEPAWG